MKMTIITQTEELVNYDNVVRISPTEIEAEDIDTNQPIMLFGIVAQTVGNSMPSEEDALTGNLVQLGIYESQEEMQNALNQLVNWLTDSSYPILHMPQPDAE